jgi:hypothetical protein
MQRQRFELKYMLDEAQAVATREHLVAHLELDENGVGKRNFSYPVHSLYLDSDHLTTFWSTINGDKYCEGLAGLPEFGVSHAGDFRETPQSQQMIVPQPDHRPRERMAFPRFNGAPAFA